MSVATIMDTTISIGYIPCPSCGGGGYIRVRINCWTCGAEEYGGRHNAGAGDCGYTTGLLEPNKLIHNSKKINCSICNGKGTITNTSTCGVCKGSGKTPCSSCSRSWKKNM